MGEKRGELSSLRTRADFLKRFTEVRNILVKYTTLVEQLNSISSLPEEKRVKELEGVIADKEMVTKMLSLREKELKGFEQILLEAEVELAIGGSILKA